VWLARGATDADQTVDSQGVLLPSPHRANESLPTPAERADDQGILAAVVAALPLLRPDQDRSLGSERALTGGHPDPSAIRAAVACYLGKTPAEVLDEEVQQFLKPIVDAANANAEQVDRFLTDYAAHLASLGCTPDDVPAYVRLGTVSQFLFQEPKAARSA